MVIEIGTVFNGPVLLSEWRCCPVK